MAGGVRSIGVEERRARLGRRHLLTTSARAKDPVSVVEGVVALHSSDPATVFLSVAARMRKPSVEALERALYEERSLVRVLGMRRTLFVVPAGFVPVVHAACTMAIAARERVRLAKLIEDAGIAKAGARWVRKVEEATMSALAARVQRDAAAIRADVERFSAWLEAAVGA